MLNKVPKLSEDSNKSSLSSPMHTSGSGSPPLKRQRTSSSNSSDMRRKLLGKAVEQKLEKQMESEKNDFSFASVDVFSVSLDEIDEMNAMEEESQSTCYKVTDPPEAENKSPTFSSISASSSSTNSPKLQTEAATKSVKWVEVSRTARKSRFYMIEATDEEEGFKAVHKASDHTKIPAGLNGKKPFLVVPGIDYGLEYETGEDCADNLADEKEIKIIKNEKYFLDSFVCDVGYLSDDELNETPSLNKFESKVRRIRRANTIKEKKKKIELLGEPEVCGPFWWSGSRGCKKEVKKWETIVLSTLPIPTSLTSPPPSVQVEKDVVLDRDVAAVAAVNDVAAAPAEVEVEDYETKYHIKYAVKFLVQSRMRERRGVVVSPQGPQDCSTPMVRRTVSAQSQVTKVSRVSQNSGVAYLYLITFFPGGVTGDCLSAAGQYPGQQPTDGEEIREQISQQVQLPALVKSTFSCRFST